MSTSKSMGTIMSMNIGMSVSISMSMSKSTSSRTRLMPWVQPQPEYAVPADAEYNDIIVPTIDTIRFV
jgi:hypothetical protein